MGGGTERTLKKRKIHEMSAERRKRKILWRDRGENVRIIFQN
jgi:hypothetical protein